MQPKYLIKLWMVLLCFSGNSAPGQAPLRARVPLNATMVANALSAQGFPVDPSRVELPSGLSTVGVKPQFRVDTAELLPEGRFRIRLSCAQVGECLPFVVTVQTTSSSGGLHDLAALQGHITAPTTPRASPGQRIAVHLLAGSRATLLMEDIHMRIAVPVIAIDSGLPGEEVRVTSLDRKQTFRAVVADARTVKGELP